jgi:methionyl-tRNA formyltransferase
VVDAAEGLVACRDGTTLQLIEVQPAGKRAMAWRDFANGQRVRGMEAATPDRLEGRV